MKVIGLTGGIGSGKSTVAQFLAELGAVIIDADKVSHEAMENDAKMQRELVAAFGKQIISPDGDIDRGKLGAIVFHDAEARSRLNRITHPRIYELVRARLREYQEQGVAVVVLEVPLLLEADWVALVDDIWVTVASEAAVLNRLTERAGLSKADSLARIRSQLPSEERVRHADVVIDTNCSLNDLKAKTIEFWQGLQN